MDLDGGTKKVQRSILRLVYVDPCIGRPVRYQDSSAFPTFPTFFIQVRARHDMDLGGKEKSKDQSNGP